LHAKAEVQPTLPKIIISHWEEPANNRHKACTRYEKEVYLHTLDYSKPIQFQSDGFFHDVLSSPLSDSPPPPKQQIVKFQYCDKVGHVKDHCFDLH